MKILLRTLKVIVYVIWAVLFSCLMLPYSAIHYIFTGKDILSIIGENSIEYIETLFGV